jgi:hypothetical protein
MSGIGYEVGRPPRAADVSSGAVAKWEAAFAAQRNPEAGKFKTASARPSETVRAKSAGCDRDLREEADYRLAPAAMRCHLRYLSGSGLFAIEKVPSYKLRPIKPKLL